MDFQRSRSIIITAKRLKRIVVYSTFVMMEHGLECAPQSQRALVGCVGPLLGPEGSDPPSNLFFGRF
jgi:hypothetical protein